MRDRQKAKKWKGHHPGGRDFWGDWHEKWRNAAERPQAGQPGTSAHRSSHHGMKANHWRQFFHDFMGIWPEHHWTVSGRRFNPWIQGEVDFNPFLASVLSKGGGLLPLIVLQLLSQRPHYGNEIMDLISQRTSGGWLANPGAIYPLLTVMEHHALIVGRWEDTSKRTRRRYDLTDSGRQELNQLLAIMLPRLRDAIEALTVIFRDLNPGE